MLDLIAFAAKDVLNVLHYGQAMKAANKKNSIETMVKEKHDHVQREHWEILPIEKVL